jgi:hypothetical protein
MVIEYPWKRFWAERGAEFFLADQGFLPDPETKEGKYLASGLEPLQVDALKSCTVLLGEPGMGKSKELRFLHKQVPAGDAEHFVDLRSYGDENRLVSSVFGAPDVSQWINGQGTLHLFLDSLDECLLRVDTAASIIADELQKFAVHKRRLRLYIASRTAPWPSFLEIWLNEFFGESELRILEIAPLRRKEVLVAAELEGVQDQTLFVQQVIDKGVTALAIKPVTLAFLIGSWRKRNSFPTTLLDLYREGCRRLCDEDSLERRAAPRLLVDSNARFATASRIAALTQLGNRFAVWKGRPSEIASDEDVPLHELVGDEEAGFPVTADLIRSTLDTGLFSSRGSDRIGWAHLTYAEFLASGYLNEHALSLSQLRTLFFHPSGTGLVPQLTEVAAWTALNNPELLREIAREDPLALLNSGVAEVTDDERKMIVEGLIAQCRKGKYLHFHWGRSAAYARLAHPQLGEQLLNELSQPDRNVQTKSFVISVGQACQQHVLCDRAVEMALDEAEDIGVRQYSVYLLSELGSKSQRQTLQQLLAGDMENTHLNALVIDALWPAILTTDQIFALLPAWEANLQLLNSFLHGRFLEGLEKKDLKSALHWVQHNEGVHGIHGSANMAILGLAWEHLDDPEVVEAFADTVASKLGIFGWFANSSRGHDFQALIDSNTERRRILVRALLSRLSPSDVSPLHYPMQLAMPEDLVWLIGQFGSLTASEQLVAVNFIRIARDTRNTNHMTALYYGCRLFPVLAEHIGVVLKPIDLNDEWVQSEREALERQKKPKQFVLDPPAEQRLEDALKISEGEGTPAADAWVNIVRQMTLEPEKGMYGDDHEASVLDLPGWIAASDETKDRVALAAERYLRHSSFFEMDWPTEGSVLQGAYGAVQALHLCVEREPSFIQANPDLATRCVRSVVRFHVHTKASQSVQQQLIQGLMVKFGEGIIVALIEEICQDNDRHGHYQKPAIVETAWTPVLGERLLHLLQKGRFKPSVVTPLLAQVLELFPEKSIAFPSSSLTDATADELKTEAITAVAVGWMKGDPKSAWTLIWPLMQQDEEFGQVMVHRLSGPIHEPARFLSEIDVELLADFFIWMAERYSYPPPNDTEDYKPTKPVYEQHLKNDALEHMKKRGSFKAVAAIQRVMKALPHYEWLRAHLDEADLQARAVTWNPFTVLELRAFMASISNRLVGSENDLQEILLESLARLQQDLRGETPCARFLWDVNGNLAQPKEEDALSDFIVTHLRRDISSRGIVVNREVQIRRSNPQGEPGQRTDIHVNAISSIDSRPVLTLIIEVKGCWHQELKTAMETQLRDRYLKENCTRTGIYVAGWYASAAWDPADDRRRRCGRTSLVDLRTFLQQQATDLSAGSDLKSLVLDCSLS